MVLVWKRKPGSDARVYRQGLALSLNELGVWRRIIGMTLFRSAIKNRFVRRVQRRVQPETPWQVGIRNEHPLKRCGIGQVFLQNLCCRGVSKVVGDNQRPMKLLLQCRQRYRRRPGRKSSFVDIIKCA